MPLLEPPAVVPGVLRNDLAHLQLEIARRADELTRSVARSRLSDLALWLQAEQEVFARRGHLRPAAVGRRLKRLRRLRSAP